MESTSVFYHSASSTCQQALALSIVVVGLLSSCAASQQAPLRSVLPALVAPTSEPTWPVPIRLLRRLPSGEMHQIGTQTGHDLPALPSDSRWFVQPLAQTIDTKELLQLFETMSEHQMPGLSLRGIRVVGPLPYQGLATLTHLAMFDGTGQAIGSKEFEAITMLGSLRALYLGDTKITDDSFAGIVDKIPLLELLDVSNTKIGDKTLRSIRNLPLRELNLEGTRVSDAASEDLASLGKTLTILRLGNTVIGDTALAWIDASSPLQLLGLWKTKIQHSSIEKIATLRALSTLNVSETDFDGRSLGLLAATPALSGLRTLTLSYTNISESDLPLLRGASRLESLGLAGTAIGTDCSSFLSQLKHFREYSLRDTGCSDDSLKGLAVHRELEFLDLGETGVTSGVGETLFALSVLRALYLDKTSVDDTVLQSLKKTRSLRVLHLAGNPLEKLAEESLSAMPWIEELNLEACHLDDSLAKGIVTGKPMLRSLDISDNDLTDEVMHSIASAKKLQVLDLSSTKIGDDGVEELVTLEHLRVLGLSDTKIADKTPLILRRFKALRHLIVQGGAESVESFSHFLGDQVLVE